MKNREGGEINELWIPESFDPEVFVREFLRQFPDGKVTSIIRNIPRAEIQTRVEYEIPVPQKDELPKFLEQFAARHGFNNNKESSSFVHSMDTWLPEWYQDPGQAIH
jgi:hypothetical protein